jgi:hypothetical protein
MGGSFQSGSSPQNEEDDGHADPVSISSLDDDIQEDMPNQPVRAVTYTQGINPYSG